jgi:hypothetical protein
MALTAKQIENAKAKDKPYKLADGGGLCLLVAPSGARLWRCRYRFAGKEKMMAFGEFPLVGLKEARDLHFAARQKLADGIDPMAERKAEAESRQRQVEAVRRQAESSFENIARRWWEWWSAGKSPRHADYVLRRLEADVFPAFGHKFIDDVNAADVRALMIASKAAARETLQSGRMKLRARSSGMRLPTASPVGIPPPISSRATFWLRAVRRISRVWTPKSCRLC